MEVDVVVGDATNVGRGCACHEDWQRRPVDPVIPVIVIVFVTPHSDCGVCLAESTWHQCMIEVEQRSCDNES